MSGGCSGETKWAIFERFFCGGVRVLGYLFGGLWVFCGGGGVGGVRVLGYCLSFVGGDVGGLGFEVAFLRFVGVWRFLWGVLGVFVWWLSCGCCLSLCGWVGFSTICICSTLWGVRSIFL